MYSIESAHRCPEAAILKLLRIGAPALLPTVLALCAALQFVQISRPSFRTMHDDGIYLITAKALAEGKGYVIDSLPKPIAQTKYPILFPAMLAAVWKVYPEFPANLPWLRLIPLACYWGWLYLVWKLIGETLGMKERAKWIVALLMSSPLLVLSLRMPMSDLTFALLSTWAVLLSTRMYVAPPPPKLGQVLQLGFAFALAYHTRAMALALLPIVTLTLWRKRSYSGLAIFGIIAAAAWAPWAYWLSLHPAPREEMLRYYTQANYADWNLLSSTRIAAPWRVSLWNALAAATWIRDTWALSLPNWLTAGYLFLAALTARGLWALSRGPGFVAALWTALVGGVVLMWPWPPLRFMMPAYPFLLLALTFSAPPIAPGVVRVVGRAAATVLITVGLVAVSQPDAEDSFWNEYSELFDWLKVNTSKEATLAGNMETSFWLYAGRKSVRSYDFDPNRLFYLAQVGSTEDAQKLEGILIAHQVDFLVFEEIPNTRQAGACKRQLEAVRARRRERLEPVFATPSGRIQVFRVRPENRPEP